MQEDLLVKFRRFCLSKAKQHEMSVDEALDYLNNTLLAELPQATLDEFKIRLPIHRATAGRWLHHANIKCGIFQKSYYSDKHEDPVVHAYRQKYIAVMDDIMFRCPLWVQIPMAEYVKLAEALPKPSEGGLVYEYADRTGAAMLEIHVDLMESLDREALPFGGLWSVRFPGWPPTSQRLPPVPPRPDELPDPGVDLKEEPDVAAAPAAPTPAAATATATTTATAAAAAAAAATAPAAATVTAELPADLASLKVPQLKAHLRARGLQVGGNKAELVARLSSAPGVAAAGTAAEETVIDDAASDLQPENFNEFEVMSVKDTRVKTINGFDVVQYLIEWKVPPGEDANNEYWQDTWENEGFLDNCPDALHDFLEAQPKEEGCPVGHTRGRCKCKCVVLQFGHDESIFKENQLSKRQWIIDGKRPIEPKTDGRGRMVSGFKCEWRGFGLPLTSAELAKANALRAAHGKTALEGSPGVRFLDYGKAREGYWTHELFCEQACNNPNPNPNLSPSPNPNPNPNPGPNPNHNPNQVVDLLDVCGALFPQCQVCLEVDNSSGHGAHRSKALNAKAMAANLGFGSIPHSSKMTAGCLGPGAMLKASRTCTCPPLVACEHTGLCEP